MMKERLLQQRSVAKLLIAMLALGLFGCKKDKLNNNIPLLNVANTSSSSIRMFNFIGGLDLSINNVPLTSYTGSTGNGTQIGLSLFPSGKWGVAEGGSPFSIPNSLLNKDGSAHITFQEQLGNNTLINFDTTVVNDVAHPKDYYLLANRHFLVVDRVSAPPVNPQDFKVRIINIGTNDDAGNLGLTGPVSMTYADGGDVSPSLKNVAQGAFSSYVELPYGTYQFKLFYRGDVTKQLAEYPMVVNFDRCTPGALLQEAIFPRVRTFKPGGVYTIVVANSVQSVFGDCPHYTIGLLENTYYLVNDLDPGANSTYARIQAFNALPDKQVTVKVDGQALGSQLPYVGSLPENKAIISQYQIFIQGSHHIQAFDQSGTLLTESNLQLNPFDNYTIWTYERPDGKPALLFEQVDMTGGIYASTYHPGGASGGNIPDDGTNGSARVDQYNYALEAKFLNLSPDLPYATFTNDGQLLLPTYGPTYSSDTIRYQSAYVNLLPGVMSARNQSIIYSLPSVSPAAGSPQHSEQLYVPKLIRLYQSKPGPLPEVPGSLVPGVDPVNVLQAFVANPKLYTTPQYYVPETGVYTVAVVGRSFTASQASQKARIIIIKHNK